MEYKVKIIEHEAQLNTCELFRIEKGLWGTGIYPETGGKMGFVKGQGFYLQMYCKERDPLRIYINDNDPVYKDSAVEAFFQFVPGGRRSDIYMNFEMNANGAMLAKYGKNRKERKELSQEDFKKCGCRAVISEGFWEVRLHIPLSVLFKVHGRFDLLKGSVFYCNFYKISEHPGIEHYASYVPVHGEHPDFHRPEDFVKARIV